MGIPVESNVKRPPVLYGGAPTWNCGYVTWACSSQKRSLVSSTTGSTARLVTLTPDAYALKTIVDRLKRSVTTSPVVKTVAAATCETSTPAMPRAGGTTA